MQEHPGWRLHDALTVAGAPLVDYSTIHAIGSAGRLAVHVDRVRDFVVAPSKLNPKRFDLRFGVKG